MEIMPIRKLPVEIQYFTKLRELDGIEVPAAILTDYRMHFKNPVPVIYQSGYLTIKGYDVPLALAGNVSRAGGKPRI